MLFEQTLANHEFKYRFKNYTKEVTELPYSEDGNRIYYPNVSQQDFEKIPGCPIGYWVSEKMINAFLGDILYNVAKPRQGLATSDNNRFLKYWYEVIKDKIGFSISCINDSNKYNYKWFPCTKGGSFRRWYGNNEYVVNWENDGEEMKAYAGASAKPCVCK